MKTATSVTTTCVTIGRILADNYHIISIQFQNTPSTPFCQSQTS